MILIKVGGGKTIRWDYVAEDVKNLQKKEKIIIVHGASVKRDEVAQKLGCPTKTVTSPSGITSVYTDEKAIEIFLMVYSGLANKTIVATLQKYGINAVGLSGVDGKLWEAKSKKELLVQEGKKVKLIKDNKTGRVEKININLIQILIKNNYVPVVSAPAISYENEIVNTDNDWAAAIMAESLKVNKLIYLFEAPGFLKNNKDESTLIKKIQKTKLTDYLLYAEGRMKKKLLGVQKAINLGIKNIYWGDGRIRKPITKVLQGKGTVIS